MGTGVAPARASVSLFAPFFAMWQLIVDEFGPEQTDKGDTLYWRWQTWD